MRRMRPAAAAWAVGLSLDTGCLLLYKRLALAHYTHHTRSSPTERQQWRAAGSPNGGSPGAPSGAEWGAGSCGILVPQRHADEQQAVGFSGAGAGAPRLQPAARAT